MGRTVKVSRTIKFTNIVPIKNYPNMSDEEIVDFERDLSIGDIVEIMDDAPEVTVDTTVRFID